MLMVAFGALLIITFNMVGGVTGRTIIVDDDGESEFEDIQAAVDHAEAGDTIRVYAGEYSGGVMVNKSVSIIGNGSSVTAITKEDKDAEVFLIIADSVSLSGFTIIGNGNLPSHPEIYSNAGIRISSSHNEISDNVITNFYFGIEGAVGGMNTITNNTIDHCNDGIMMILSSNNMISGSSVTRSTRSGLYMTVSSNNQICNNSIMQNSLYGIYLANSNGNQIIDNHISNNSDGIHLIQTQNNQIAGNVVQYNEHGILVNGSIRSILHGTEYSYNRYGLYLYNSNDNELNDTTFTNNSRDIVLNISNNNDMVGLDPSVDIYIIGSHEERDDSFHFTFPMIMTIYILIVTLVASIFFQRKRIRK